MRLGASVGSEVSVVGERVEARGDLREHAETERAMSIISNLSRVVVLSAKQPAIIHVGRPAESQPVLAG